MSPEHPSNKTSVAEDIRPFKRQKTEHVELQSIPQDVLLLSLPHFLIHPPTHRNHTRSLLLSLFALRKCLTLPNLDSISEFRAWTELAEIGFRIGLREPGIESEVGKAITKALMIAHKHPSLRIYKPQITQLSARLAAHQRNHKLAQNTLKKTLTQFLIASDPPHVTYAAHLAYITSLSEISQDDEAGPYSPSQANMKALTAIKDLHALALRNSHREVALLAMVLELRDLMQNGVWTRVGDSLKSTEAALDIFPQSDDSTPLSHPPSPIPGPSNLEKVLILHAVIIGVLYYTYTGDSAAAHIRLKKLHDMLDGGVMEAFGRSGIVEAQIPHSTPLRVQVTHPRVIYALGFLVSSVTKRDPVGRKPKRRLFAAEGVCVVDKELNNEVNLPIWASVVDIQMFHDRMHKMKADLICELVGVSISRSEFDEAERHIAQLIAHTRTYGLFSTYCGRITLHQAHLAHALGRAERALKCYQVAALLSQRRTGSMVVKEPDGNDEEDGCEDRWVNVSARAGEIWLRIGIASDVTDEAEWERTMEPLRKMGADVTKECEGLGGTLQAVGALLAACLSKEFLVTKTHLRTALNLSTAAQDNYLRPLVLALVAAQYVHTSTEHAEAMLGTAEQLAAGLGARPKAPRNTNGDQNALEMRPRATGDGVGNAHLRMWIGERALELKRRTADEKGAAKQAAANEVFKEAIVRVQKRKFAEVNR